MEFFSSESVGIGHPDKIADRISDSIFDKALSLDKDVKFACEVLVSKGLVSIAGEVFSKKFSIQELDAELISKEVLESLDYDSSKFNFFINLQTQSADINESVVKSTLEIGSGDQGVVFGYATNETPNFLPFAHLIATDLVFEAEKLIKNKTFSWAKYDMKSLIFMKKETNKFKIDTLIFSIQHDSDISLEKIKEEVEKHLLIPCLKKKHALDLNIENKFINSSGRFEIGGLDADSGVTNRKLAVDSYGSICRHGGGGYSGKDLTKVDRLGAYYARWICKNLVASGVCEFVELQIIFYLGGIKPVNFTLKKDHNTPASAEEIVDLIRNVFPQSISEIISIFYSPNLKYSSLSVYGHFGRDDLNLPWERLDKVEEIKKYLKSKNAR